jgi:hypothetical protein
MESALYAPPTHVVEFSRGRLTAFLLAVLMLSCVYGWLAGYFAANHAIAKASVIPSARPELSLTAVPPTAVVTPIPSVSVADVAADGEGINNPFVRQLTANPSLFDSPICKNRPTAKERTGCNAYVLMVQAGLIDSLTGAEIRIYKEPNFVAFVIEKNADGSLQVAEYSASRAATNMNAFTKVKTFPVAGTLAASHFIGSSSLQTVHLYVDRG